MLPLTTVVLSRRLKMLLLQEVCDFCRIDHLNTLLLLSNVIHCEAKKLHPLFLH